MGSIPHYTSHISRGTTSRLHPSSAFYFNLPSASQKLVILLWNCKTCSRAHENFISKNHNINITLWKLINFQKCLIKFHFTHRYSIVNVTQHCSVYLIAWLSSIFNYKAPAYGATVEIVIKHVMKCTKNTCTQCFISSDIFRCRILRAWNISACNLFASLCKHE